MSDQPKFAIGQRVRILYGSHFGEEGIVYRYLPSRPWPWHVRPDSYSEDEYGIAYKEDELEPVESGEVGAKA